jgi:RNA polymerase sigma-70 factor (ECF subfamily)
VTELSAMSDGELIELAKRSDHAAYRELVQRYKQAGYGVALQVLRNPPDAEDALQEAFIKAYVYLHS